MKDSNLILETAVLNAFKKITESRGYEIASMKYEDLQKAIADNEDWDYVRELQNEVVDAMYRLLQMKKFIYTRKQLRRVNKSGIKPAFINYELKRQY